LGNLAPKFRFGLLVIVEAPQGQLERALAGIAAAKQHRSEAVLIGERGRVEGLTRGTVLPEAIEDMNGA
jgi:type II secretory pathway component PulC